MGRDARYRIIRAAVTVLIVGLVTGCAPADAPGASATPASAAPVSETASGFGLVLRRGDQEFMPTSAESCETVGSSYFERICQALLEGDWRSIEVPDPGPSPEMYGLLLRATLDHDPSVCSDERVVLFTEVGSHVDATTATTYCEDTMERAWKDGQVSIYDPSDVEGEPPLVVVIQ